MRATTGLQRRVKVARELLRSFTDSNVFIKSSTQDFHWKSGVFCGELSIDRVSVDLFYFPGVLTPWAGIIIEDEACGVFIDSEIPAIQSAVLQLSGMGLKDLSSALHCTQKEIKSWITSPFTIIPVKHVNFILSNFLFED